MKSKILLILSLFSFYNYSTGQNQSPQILKNEIRIRPFILENQVKSLESFISENVAKTEIFDSRFFRLVRFEKVLSKTQRKSLEASGIQLEGYIPYNSYLVSFPAQLDKSILQNFNVLNVISLNPENKVSKQVLKKWNSSELTGSEDLEILVECYISVSKTLIEKSFKPFGLVSPYGTHKRTYALKVKSSQLRQITNLPFVKYLEIAPGKPIPDDTKGRSLHRNNTLDNDFLGGLNYDGKGVAVALADDGEVGPHIDFKGRLTSFTNGDQGSHGDMTSGLVVGAGNLDPRYRGMATGAKIFVYNIGGYPQINNSIQNLSNLKTVITSTSYSEGCNEYTTTSEDGDSKLYENKPLMFIFSGGNNSAADCSYGAGAGWGNITGGYKNGKNTIATGNIDASGVIDPTSSRGPAPDGRIKPDICANGRGQMSTAADNTYQVGGGTSAACPSLAGVTAQLYQAWREIKSESNPEAGLIKGVLLNTADDLGKTGPDYVYGWGRVNAYNALKTIQENRYKIDSIENGITKTFPITIPAGAQNFKVMIYWVDPAGIPNADISLVNNLDLTVKRPDNGISLPWRLNSNPDPLLLNAAAGFGVDSLNNMEQVNILTPSPGVYEVTVKGKSVPEGPQRFYMVYQIDDNKVTLTYPFGGEGFVPGESELLRWDAVGTATPFNISYSPDSGQTWTSVNSPSGNLRQYNWLVPNTATTGKALIRISRGTESNVNQKPFAIAGLPTNLRIISACPDSLKIGWNAVSGISKYEVSLLGPMYMDSVGTTNATELKVPYNFNQDVWYSVRSILPNGTKGRRALAKFKTPGLSNCVLSVDAQLAKAISPNPGTVFNCEGYSNYKVRILLRNLGINPVSNIPVSYKFNTNPFVSEVVTNTLQPGDSLEYAFISTINLTPSSNNKIVLAANLQSDQNFINDTLSFNFVTAANPSGTLTQNFQSSIFPPTQWSLFNADGSTTWTRSSSIPGPLGFSTNAARMDNFTANANGSRDFLLGPLVDLSQIIAPKLIFDRAYASRLSRKDSLMVEVSSNCGRNFVSTGYAKGFAELSTVGSRTTLFVPANDTEWKSDTIDLSPFSGSKLQVRFVNVSRFGNVLYIDNIRTTGIVSTQNLAETKPFNIYPNPSETKISIELPEFIDANASYKITGMDGRNIETSNISRTGENSADLDVSHFPSGIYSIRITSNGKIWQSRFSRK